jgi:hypothetical protein
MSQYFVIPYDKLPDNPDYKVWYATWTTEPPKGLPPEAKLMVVGVTTGDRLPNGAVSLASSDKDPLPPPPPDLLAYEDSALSAYQDSFKQWLARAEDEQPSAPAQPVLPTHVDTSD